MRRAAAVLVLLSLLLSGCLGGGGSDDEPSPQERAEQGTPVLGQSGDEEPAGPALGFPVFATKNTTRVGGADPVADAAAVAQAVYPVALGGHPARRRSCSSTRTTGGRASPPRSSPPPPLGAPVLFTEGDELPPATRRRARQAPAHRRRAGRAARR